MNSVGDQGQGEKPHGPLRLETESRNGHGVETAVPRPQPPECGRHVMSPCGEPHEGDPAAQQPQVGTGTSPPTPAIRRRRGKRPSATAPRNLGSGYRANGASTRTAESGMGERITIAVVQNGAR